MIMKNLKVNALLIQLGLLLRIRIIRLLELGFLVARQCIGGSTPRRPNGISVRWLVQTFPTTGRCLER